jgi:hypothetical protein
VQNIQNIFTECGHQIKASGFLPEYRIEDLPEPSIIFSLSSLSAMIHGIRRPPPAEQPGFGN